MARKSATKTNDNLSDTGTSTVANRRAAEAERQAAARATRDELAKQTAASRKATAKRLADKPTDTRKLTA